MQASGKNQILKFHLGKGGDSIGAGAVERKHYIQLHSSSIRFENSFKQQKRSDGAPEMETSPPLRRDSHFPPAPARCHRCARIHSYDRSRSEYNYSRSACIVRASPLLSLGRAYLLFASDSQSQTVFLSSFALPTA